MYPHFIRRAIAVPNQGQSIVFSRKTTECIWLGTTYEIRLTHELLHLQTVKKLLIVSDYTEFHILKIKLFGDRLAQN